MAYTDIGIRVLVLGAGEARRQIGMINGDLSRFANNIKTSSSSIDRFGKSMVDTGSIMTAFGRTLTFSVTAPILGLIGVLEKTGIQFEDAFAGVTKTVDGVAKGFDELAKSMFGTTEGLSDEQKNAVFANEAFGDLTKQGKELRDMFRDMALTLPISVNELAKVGQIAGQLGVRGNKNIIEFTNIIAKLGIATNLSTEEAAFAIARTANVYGVETDKMGEFAASFGAALTELGNTAAVNESEITSIVLRMAAVGRMAGISVPQILGLGASMAAMGVRSERGGTAFSRVVYAMLEAVQAGGENLETFAKIANMTGAQFTEIFKRDPVEALGAFLSRLTELQEAGQVTKETLTELGFEGVRVREVMNILGPNMELVTRNINSANKEWERQVALEEEARKRFKTIASFIQIAKNAFIDLGITIFDLTRDDLQKLIEGFARVVTQIKELDPAMLKLILRIGLIASAVGPALIAFGLLEQLIGNTILANNSLARSLGKLIKLPLGMLGLGGLFGGKDLVKGGVKQVGGITKLWGKIFGTPKAFIGPLIGSFTGAFSKVFNLIFKSGLTKAVVGLPQFIFKLFRGVFTTALALIPGIGPIFSGIFKVITLPIQSALGIVMGGLSKTFGLLGGLIGGTIKRLPMFGSTLLQFVLKPLGLLPKLALVGAAAFALLFGPKVISAIIKNREKVSAELKLSANQFKEDVKKSGLEKAIMLFVSGGSTGSGRKGGVLGLVKALGASEQHAKQFAYAMGVATHWVIQIVKDTTTFVRRLITGREETEKLGKKAKSTSDVFIAIASGIAKFFAGFHQAWIGMFGEIERAFDGFRGAIGGLGDALTTFFEAVFGEPEDKVDEFQERLMKGSGETVNRVGETVGKVLGQIVALALQGLTLIVQIATAITDAFTNLVNAYHAGGVKNVFAELGPSLAIIWDGVVTGLGMLWNNVEPGLLSFLTSLGTWIEQTGIPAVKAGAESLAKTLGKGLEDFWGGKGAAFENKKMTQAFQKGWGGVDVLGELVDPADWKKQQQLLMQGWSLRPTIVTTQTSAGTTGFQTTLNNALQSIWDNLTSDETQTKITGALTTVAGWLRDALGSEGVWGVIEPVAKKLGNDIVDAIGDGVKDKLTPDWLASIYNNIFGEKGKLETPTSQGNFLGMNALDGYADGAETALNTEMGVVMTRVETDDFLSGTLLGQAQGKGIDEGLGKGLDENRQIAIDALSTVATKLMTSFKMKLAIWSPSMVFFGYGQSIIQGLIQGMSSQQWALQGVLNSVLSQFSTFSFSINSIITSTQTAINAFITAITTVMTGITGSITTAVGTLFGSAPSTRTTTNKTTQNTYAPSFYGPQPPATYQQNRSLYDQYLMSTQVLAQG